MSAVNSARLMCDSVRSALLKASLEEYRPGKPGFRVAMAGGTTAVVEFAGMSCRGQELEETLGAYERALNRSGFSAETVCTAYDDHLNALDGKVEVELGVTEYPS
jgi:hypothetical protein